MDSPCATQLTTAVSCVDADPATCACYTQPFNETLVNDLGGAYRTTMAFEIPGSDEFCTTANDNVCIKLEAMGGCCCTTEINDWLTCSFESDWSPQFGAGDCAFNQCSAAEAEGGGGSSMLIIIIAVVITVLLCCCCCCCGCYYYRRKRRAAEATANESTSKDVRDAGRRFQPSAFAKPHCIFLAHSPSIRFECSHRPNKAKIQNILGETETLNRWET